MLQQPRLASWEAALRFLHSAVQNRGWDHNVRREQSQTLVRSGHPSSVDLSSIMKLCLRRQLAEEAFHSYHACLVAGEEVSDAADRAALCAAQSIGPSQWNASRRLLHLFAADKGVDLESGELLQSAPPKQTHHGKASHALRHPAWDVCIRGESVAERFAISVERDLQCVRAAFQCWHTDRAVGLSVTYALFQLQRLLADTALRRSVQASTFATILAPLVVTLPPWSANSQLRNGSVEAPTAAGSDIGIVLQRLDRLETVLPRLSRQCSVSEHLIASCADVDRWFLHSCGAAYFSQPSAADAWSEAPAYLEWSELRSVFPALPHTAAGVEQRVRHIVQRTLRADVSQGVIVPDANYVLSHFDRVVSLSQHREVVLSFHTLLQLVGISSPGSCDWRKHIARRCLRQLLQSLTTDTTVCTADAPRNRRSGEGVPTHYGGVTVLGLVDELHILERMRSDMVWCNRALPCQSDEMLFLSTSPEEATVLAAKYLTRSRHQIAFGGGRTAESFTDQVLADFGISPTGRKVSEGRVTVLSDSPETKRLASILGVEVTC